jgi:dTDP-4-dehydrorhamnose reductase
LEPKESVRSLIIGASGQVGALLYQLVGDEEDCLGTYCHHPLPGLRRLDLRDLESARQLIREMQPNVCYLPGALTFVDYAEAHPQECHEINVLATSHLARAVAEIKGLLVFFSSDHVFSDSPRPWKEDDPVSPQSVYARSKAEAEQIMRETLPDQHLILRTSWVFGPDPQKKNFLWRVRRTLEKGESLIAPSDQHGQPTYGADLAKTAGELVQRGARGTFHVVGPQYLSRLAWARLIAETLELPTDLIQGQATSQLDLVAPRPLHISLDRTKLLSFLGADPIRSPKAAIQHWITSVSSTPPVRRRCE